MANASFKLRLITTDGKWPYVGNAYVNRNGSISIYLDAGITVTGGQKLYLQTTRAKEQTTDAPEVTE